MARLLVAAFALLIGANVWMLGRHGAGARNLDLRPVHSAAWQALHSREKAIQERYAPYHRIASDLRGKVLHMDAQMDREHGWILSGLARIDIEISRRKLVQIRAPFAAPLIERASYTTKVAGRRVHVLLDARADEYVLTRVGRRENGRLLIVPLTTFREQQGKIY